MSFCLLLALAGHAPGEVQVSLPLEGYYRPGRFMPVHVKVQAERNVISLHAIDSLPTLFQINGNNEGIVPWLTTGNSVREAAWEAGGVGHPIELTLHPLNDRQKLVAIAGADSQIALALFPDMTVIAIPLDISRPVLKPASAWESLDAAVLSSTAMAQLDDEQIQTLLAAGTYLVVRSVTRPDIRWPWKQSGANWILKHQPAGPAGCIDADVYGPTYSWDRGWPKRFRREIIIWATLFCIVFLAVSLWRSRWTAWGCATACIVAALVFGLRYSRQSPVLELQTAVGVNDQKLTQLDLWSWRTTLRETDVHMPTGGLTSPILATAGQAEQLNVQLICAPDGNPREIRCHLKPGQSIALRRRLVIPVRSFGGLSTIPEDWRQFAQDLYTQPGDRIMGEIIIRDPTTDESIPAIVVNRQ